MQIKKALSIAGVMLAALGTLETSKANAESIAISNPSFEQPSLSDNSFTIENIPGWSVINTGNPGVFNPPSTAFGSVPDGENTLYSNGGTVIQTLPTSLTPNTTYTLGVSVGKRLDFTNFPGFTIELRAGDSLLASANETNISPPAPGQFERLTLSYTSASSVPAGQRLEIRLKSSGPQTNFDFVTLDSRPSISSTNKYKIFVESVTVARDQRTRFINFEGKLELRGLFTAFNVASPIYPQNGAADPRANIQVNQGEMLSPNLEITDVTVGSGSSITIPLKAELWELEFGGQGSDDYGVATANMTLDGSEQVVRISIPVEISADTSRERGGRAIVTFIAIKQ